MNPFKAIGNAIKNSVEAIFGKGPWSDEYQEVINLLPKALDAVQYIADRTKDFEADNNFAELARIYLNRPVTIKEATQSRSDLLRSMARAILQGKLVGVQQEHILNAAIEMAMVAFKKGATVK